MDFTSTPSSMSSAPTYQAPPTVAHKPPRILACVLCQHRKIKCDRNFPCANCIKTNVKCTPSTPAPARKRRRPNQDLQERLARCEELLKEYAAEKPDTEAATPQRSQAAVPDDTAYMKWQPTGKLVTEEGSVRFMDNPLIGSVYEELRAMRNIVDAEDSDEATPDSGVIDDNADLLLGAESPSDVDKLWPDAARLFRLWQIYLERVNPLTKIIHVPSVQPYLAEAVAGPQNVPKNIEALLFSIFLMAVVSMTPDECQGLLGHSREQALRIFSAGVRASLAKIGFLKSHDLTTLQSLVIYLISLQGRYNRHAAWILNGVVIRIAQKMGLHRDGETLGLGPFESEMRRRLWWQIIMVDSKYAIFSGLSHSLLPRNWNTKRPRNINDADMFPSATEPFQDREGPTEMIFCLLTYRFAKFLVETPGFESLVMGSEPLDGGDGPEGVPTESQLAKFRQKTEVLGQELLEILDKYCDPSAGPVHGMAITMRKHIIDKINELVTPPTKQPEWGGEIRSAKDHTFKVAIGALEHNEASYMSSKDKGFTWFTLIHFQLDIFMYMVGQLCHRTEGNLVERAWKQVEVVLTFHPELLDVSSKAHAALAVFILKAWKKREAVLLARTGQLPDVPFYVDQLRAAMPNEDYKSEPTPPNPYTPEDLLPAPQVPTDGGEFDQFLGYLDGSALDWDMFGTAPMNTGQNTMPYGFGLGPTVDW